MTQSIKTLIVSEYFPHLPDQMVHGVFQRLRRHADALGIIGSVDFVFMWPLHWSENEDRQRQSVEDFRRSWSVAGRIILISPPALPSRFRRWPRDLGIRDVIAATRGAVSFTEGRVTMRSSRMAEVSRLERAIRELKPDLILAHRLASTAALIRTVMDLPPVLVDFDDLEHVALGRSRQMERSPAKRLKLSLVSAVARRTERLVAGFATVGLVCSEHDRKIVEELSPGARIEVAPNAAVMTGRSPMPSEPTALFVGYTRYPPNAEAILWLVGKVFPLVRARLPRARLLIAGDGGRELGIDDAGAGVETLGFVTDLSSAYARARVVVCPVKRGGGTRIKIIEAALYGRPVVSTSIGAEGLGFIDGKEVVLANEEGAFAEAMVELMSSDERSASIGAAAEERARQLYGAEQVRSNLAALARSMVDPDTAQTSKSELDIDATVNTPIAYL
ncbi:glycosyltransferase [Mesorhizobium sp. M0179]|uniref:glycosyltransferase n=1 Tax=unclassified Mesorhizobium TaxID=325217 RepID=UPI0003F7698C|nr:glycosyltransferase [Mesorhizobium sp. LSJC265A00]